MGVQERVYKVGSYYNLAPMRVGVHINKGPITTLPPESGCSREDYKQGTYYNFTTMRVGVQERVINKGPIITLIYNVNCIIMKLRFMCGGA